MPVKKMGDGRVNEDGDGGKGGLKEGEGGGRRRRPKEGAKQIPC